MSGVLVAVDGSAAATAAVAVAADAAARRGESLTVGHVVEATLVGGGHGPDPLPAAVATAQAAAPDLEVRALGRTGPVDAVLLDLARDHDLIVLGSRGHGALRDAAWGSHAVALAAAAPCPVLVVRPGAERRRPGGPVVAALARAGGSAALDEAVLDVAFAEAAGRGVPLVVVHGLESHRIPRNGRVAVSSLLLAALSVGGADPGEAVRVQVDRWSAEHPEVEVRVDVRRGRAAPAVLEAARGAGLLVVGTRGRGTRAALLRGSVSQAVLHHAHCPVFVVPPVPVANR